MPTNHKASVFAIPMEMKGPPIPKIATKRVMVSKLMAKARRNPDRAMRTSPMKINFLVLIRSIRRPRQIANGA